MLCIHEQHGHAHLDLKSPNILLNNAGVAKIADFGLASFEDSTAAVNPPDLSSLSREEFAQHTWYFRETIEETTSADGFDSKARVGTPEWMAPEMYLEGESSKSCDVYSFGIVMWEMLARARPYTGFDAGAALTAASVAQLVPLWASLGRRPAVPKRTMTSMGMPDGVADLFETLMTARLSRHP